MSGYSVLIPALFTPRATGLVVDQRTTRLLAGKGRWIEGVSVWVTRAVELLFTRPLSSMCVTTFLPSATGSSAPASNIARGAKCMAHNSDWGTLQLLYTFVHRHTFMHFCAFTACRTISVPLHFDAIIPAIFFRPSGFPPFPRRIASLLDGVQRARSPSWYMLPEGSPP